MNFLRPPLIKSSLDTCSGGLDLIENKNLYPPIFRRNYLVEEKIGRKLSR